LIVRVKIFMGLSFLSFGKSQAPEEDPAIASPGSSLAVFVGVNSHA